MVVHIENLDAFNAALKNAGDKLVVVDFTATWCGPCQKIGPVFESLSKSEDYQNVVFLKVDVDSAACVLRVPYLMNRYRDGAQRGYWLLDVSSHCDIKCMPTFHFYKNGQKIDEFSGANEQTLKQKINNHK